MTEQILDNWGRSFTLPGTYSDFTHFNRLVYIAPDGSRNPIELNDEPVGWSNLKFTLKRGEMHGVNAEYSSSSDALEFDGYSGRDFVESIFRSEGEDATILFQWGITIPELIGPDGVNQMGFEVIEYEGRLNLSLRKTTQRRAVTGLERSTLQSRVTAKQETSVSLSATRSLDNIQIVPPTFSSIPLTPQSLDERFICNVAAGKAVEQSFQGDTNGHVWVQFDTSAPQVSEIDEFASGRPMGVSASDGPITNDQWLFKFRSSGIRQVTIDLGYKMNFNIKKRTISVGPASVTGYTYNTRLTLLRVDGTRQDWEITTPLAEGLAKRPPRTDFRRNDILIVSQGKLDVQIDTRPGDRLFLYGLLSFTHNKNELQQTAIRVAVTTERITISGKAKNSSSSVRCLPIHDALNAALTVITGLPDRLRSPFYGLANDRYPVDGCGSRRVVFNGFAARHFKQLERPLAISFGDLVESLAVLDCIGLQYGHEIGPDDQPIEIVSINPIQDFYRNVELLRLDEVSEYSEDTITGEIYSTVEVGYQDFVSEGAGALEEVFTLHQVTTPIKHEAEKKVLTSKLIASSLAIEQTRREQFADTPKDGTTYDEKVFIVQCKPIAAYSGVATFIRGFIGYIIQVAGPISWLSVGQKIVISGTALNDGTYTVTVLSDANKRPWSFYVAEEVIDETAFSFTTAPADGTLELQPETGADFDSVMGLQSPDDTLNLRLTPGRILLQTAPVWAGCLINKDKYNLINKKPITETGLIDVSFQRILFLNAVITNIYQDWIAAGMSVEITGNGGNVSTFTVIAVSEPDYSPWGFFVKEPIVEGFGSAVNISFKSIGIDDLYASVNKTKIPNNKSVVTGLPITDTCGKSGRVAEAEPVGVDELIDSLLYLPRLYKFKVRLSHAQIQRLRLGHSGLLPADTDTATGEQIDPNFGYISFLNEAGIRLAGFLNNIEYSRDNESAVFELRASALNLNNTLGADCGQFVGWTLEQAEAADEKTRRRIELCRFIDVDPL